MSLDFKSYLQMMEVSMTDNEFLTKAEVLEELTKLYDICMNSSSELDDSWFRIAGVISNAEDVVIQEMKDE